MRTAVPRARPLSCFVRMLQQEQQPENTPADLFGRRRSQQDGQHSTAACCPRTSYARHLHTEQLINMAKQYIARRQSAAEVHDMTVSCLGLLQAQSAALWMVGPRLAVSKHVSPHHNTNEYY